MATVKALYNRCLDGSSQFYEWENPVPQVKLIKEPEGRVRFLEPKEEANLLAAAKEPLRTIILLRIYAGLRIQSEALTLRSCDVDMKGGLLTVQAACEKSGQTRTVETNSISVGHSQHIRSETGVASTSFMDAAGSPTATCGQPSRMRGTRRALGRM